MNILMLIMIYISDCQDFML